MTCAQFNAIGSNGTTGFTTNINFNVQVPSQETVLSRNALISTTLQFEIVATPKVYSATLAGSGYIFNYGGIDGFGPFPFHQLVNSVQWTINNNTISQNTRDILSTLCRIHDKRFLQRYNGMTPVLYDTYGSYASLTAGSTNNNPFLGWDKMGLDNDLAPRGILPISVTGTNFSNPGDGTTPRTITVSIAVTEPVLLSPFVFAGDEGQGMYGIQNFNAVYNLSSNANAAVRFGGSLSDRYTTLPTVTFKGALAPKLLLQFLTPHPSDLLPSRNVVPYYELPRYISTCPAIVTNASSTIVSSALQLNQIPDKLYIVCTRQMDNRLVSDADAFLTITGISINWNNSSGLLSSATQQDLWRMTVENGINQTWAEFSGIADIASATASGVTAVSTCGSVLCLEFGKDIELKDDYYAPGSLGNFQLQFNLQVTNNLPNTSTNFSMITIVQNSGVFSLERGVSSSYLGILTKSDVLEASREKAVAYSDAIRMVGGGKVGNFFKSLGSKLGTVGKYALPIVRDLAVGAIKKKIGMGSTGAGKRDMGALEDRMY